MARYRVIITGKDFDAMADLVRKHKLTVACHTTQKLAQAGYRVDAYATDAQIKTLTKVGYKVRRLEDVNKVGKARQAEVRAAAMKASLTAAKAAVVNRYRTVEEIEAAVAAVAAPPNDTFTDLIALPEKSWEQRRCEAIRIGKGHGPARPGIYFLGGVHAREWGSPDILVNFVELLTTAYRTHAGITIGTKKFTAAQIQSIVNDKDIYVFPQANPDGRKHSMTNDPMWRKNRRPAQGAATCAGVDINRNYEFLWNYPKYFDPAAPIANSVDPCDDTYIGPSAFSEPETRNAAWMFDHFSNIRYFVDVHSYAEDILYGWGDDVAQTTNPSMSFQNAAYDGQRGIATDTAYREYIASADKAAIVKLANQMRAAIKAVRGRAYTVMQAVGMYPTAGTSRDYAFSRCLTDETKNKVYSYTIEWGSKNNQTPFHPKYTEMRKIIREVTAGLLEFCRRAGS